MNRLVYNDPLHIIWRKGTVDDPYVDKTETRKVLNNLLVLDEIPDEFTRVSVEGFREIRKGIPQEGEFIVSYQTGIVGFHPSVEGKSVTAIYKGRGIIQYPAQRIYAHSENPDVIINLQEIIDNSQAGIDALSQIVSKLNEVDVRIAQAEAVREGTILATEAANVAASNAVAKIGEMDSKLDEADSAIQSADAATADALTAAQGAITAKQEADAATSAAITATSGANEAASRADIATQDANAARDAANTAAGVANTAADKADAATGRADTATANANMARDDAISATSDANTATENANAAASEANSAATNANTQAGYAQEQGDYALAKGDYADQQGIYAKEQGDYAKAQGSAAESAIAAIVHLGEYNASTPYVKNNSVRYEGSTYICKLDCVGVLPTDDTHWELAALKGRDGVGDVDSVNGKTGHVVLGKEDVGLGNVDDTSDLDKPISTATQAALDTKVDNSRVLTDVPADVTYVHVGPTAPTNTDMLWLDTSTTPRRLKYYNGTIWIVINTYA